MKREIPDLRKEVSSIVSKNAYKHIIVRVALLKNAGSEEFAFGRIDYSSQPTYSSNAPQDYGDFKLIQQVFDIEESDKILSDIVNGSILIGGNTIDIKVSRFAVINHQAYANKTNDLWTHEHPKPSFWIPVIVYQTHDRASN
jgi:hypothetical protein